MDFFYYFPFLTVSFYGRLCFASNRRTRSQFIIILCRFRVSFFYEIKTYLCTPPALHDRTFFLRRLTVYKWTHSTTDAYDNTRAKKYMSFYINSVSLLEFFSFLVARNPQNSVVKNCMTIGSLVCELWH